MNRLIHMWPLMAEAGEDGGGAAQTEQQPTEQQPTEQQPTEQQPTEQQPTEQQPVEQKPVNLMDDDPEETATDENQQIEAPTDEQVKSFRDGLKSIDLGEGVTFDDPALDAMQAPLMELAANDPKKAEGLVKAYTEYRREELRKMQEQDDAFNNGLVKECEKRFGKDQKQICALAKIGGKKIFGDALWNQIKSVRQFANNPDIIERLAAFGKSVKDDPGAVRKETGSAPAERDWRESMYGAHK